MGIRGRRCAKANAPLRARGAEPLRTSGLCEALVMRQGSKPNGRDRIAGSVHESPARGIAARAPEPYPLLPQFAVQLGDVKKGRLSVPRECRERD